MLKEGKGRQLDEPFERLLSYNNVESDKQL